MNKIGAKIYLLLFLSSAFLSLVTFSLIYYFQSISSEVEMLVNTSDAAKNIIILKNKIHNDFNIYLNSKNDLVNIEKDLNYEFKKLKEANDIIRANKKYKENYESIGDEIVQLEFRIGKALGLHKQYIMLASQVEGRATGQNPLESDLDKNDSESESRRLKDLLYTRDYYEVLSTEDFVDINFQANHIINEINKRYNEIIAQNLTGFTTTIILILFTVFASGIIVYFVVLGIVNPINKLTAIAKRASSGDLTGRVKVTSKDEIGYLSAVFNDMLTVIDEFQKESKVNLKKLEELNLGLEQKVKDRTQELEKVKAGLENTVAERTNELEKKLVELERFHDLTVGRELKMVELKKKINKLGGDEVKIT